MASLLVAVDSFVAYCKFDSFCCLLQFMASLWVADLVAYQIVKQVQLYGIDDIINGTVLSTTILEPSAGGEGGFADVQAVGSLALVLNPAGAIEGKPFSVQPVLQVRSTEVSTRLPPLTPHLGCS